MVPTQILLPTVHGYSDIWLLCTVGNQLLFKIWISNEAESSKEFQIETVHASGFVEREKIIEITGSETDQIWPFSYGRLNSWRTCSKALVFKQHLIILKKEQGYESHGAHHLYSSSPKFGSNDRSCCNLVLNLFSKGIYSAANHRPPHNNLQIETNTVICHTQKSLLRMLVALPTWFRNLPKEPKKWQQQNFTTTKPHMDPKSCWGCLAVDISKKQGFPGFNQKEQRSNRHETWLAKMTLSSVD